MLLWDVSVREVNASVLGSVVGALVEGSLVITLVRVCEAILVSFQYRLVELLQDLRVGVSVREEDLVVGADLEFGRVVVGMDRGSSVWVLVLRSVWVYVDCLSKRSEL